MMQLLLAYSLLDLNLLVAAAIPAAVTAAAWAAAPPAAAAAAAQIAVLHRLDMAKYPLARCLDGSPGAFSVYRDTQQRSTKWELYHEGGGWCANDVPADQGSDDGLQVDSCYHRSLGWLGSTAARPNTTLLMPADPGGWGCWAADCPPQIGGILSGDPNLNPLMAGWNKVELAYCSGDSFAGRNTTVAVVGGKALHSARGGFILDAVIDTLLTLHGLAAATEVVVTGSSAGGLAAYLHAERYRAALPPTAFMAVLSDGGFFLDYDAGKPAVARRTYAAQMRANFGLFNASGGVNQACVASFREAGADVSSCYFAEHTLPFIPAPVFAVQSTTDAWQLPNILGSTTDPTLANGYREELSSRLLGAFGGRADRGGFFDSCYHHCGLWESITVDGTRMADAFTQWYQQQHATWLDKAAGDGDGAVTSGQPQRSRSGGRLELGDAAQRKMWWQGRAFPCEECCPPHPPPPPAPSPAVGAMKHGDELGPLSIPHHSELVVMNRTGFVYHPNASTVAGAVLVLHGSGGVASDMFGLGFESLADARNFVVVYPEMRVPKGSEWGYLDDIPYFGALARRLQQSDFGVPADKIFVCGHSAGGTMVTLLQNEMDEFAAAGVVEAAVGHLSNWTMARRGKPTMVVWNHADPVLKEYAPGAAARETVILMTPLSVPVEKPNKGRGGGQQSDSLADGYPGGVEMAYYNLTIDTLRRGASTVPDDRQKLPKAPPVTQVAIGETVILLTFPLHPYCNTH